MFVFLLGQLVFWCHHIRANDLSFHSLEMENVVDAVSPISFAGMLYLPVESVDDCADRFSYVAQTPIVRGIPHHTRLDHGTP